jgi:hypothetical protein
MKKALMIMYMAIAVSTAQAQSPLSFYAGRCVVMHDAPSFLFITDINRFIFFKLVDTN